MKHILKSKRYFFLFAFMTGALMLTQLTACTEVDDVCDDTKDVELIINGILPTDDSVTRSGSLVDNGTYSGGMTFKWLSSSDKMTAVVFSYLNGNLLEWKTASLLKNLSVNVAVIPDPENDHNAELTPAGLLNSVDLSDLENNTKVFIIQNLQNKEENESIQSVSGDLTMPLNNLFKQTEINSTSHLNEYLFMMGEGSIFAADPSTYSDNPVANVDVVFRPVVATIRLKVTNYRADEITIKNINIKSSVNDYLFPNLKEWKATANTSETSPTICESNTFFFYKTITAQYGDTGFKVASGQSIFNYVAVHQHDQVNYLQDRYLDFEIETSAGIYTAYNFDCNKLSSITGNKDFVAGYTYTFSVSLKDKLCFDGVTVTGWTEEKVTIPLPL